MDPEDGDSRSISISIRLIAGDDVSASEVTLPHCPGNIRCSGSESWQQYPVNSIISVGLLRLFRDRKIENSRTPASKLCFLNTSDDCEEASTALSKTAHPLNTRN
jgi:hypothetical protein